MPTRIDNANKKRVELHLHTNMSELTHGAGSAEDMIRKAAMLGHTAVAITDDGVVQAFPEAMEAAEKLSAEGTDIKIIYGVTVYDDFGCEHIILVKNSTGLKNLYKLLSLGHMHHFYDNMPHIPKGKLINHHDGLIIGCASQTGELFKAFINDKPWNELCERAVFYDFLEIFPGIEEQYTDKLEEYNKMIVRLGEELNIPVCACGNVHMCEPEDEIIRDVLAFMRKTTVAKITEPLCFYTTDEMLRKLDYLGKEKAYEVVVENTNCIADSIEYVRPIPMGYYPPHIDGAEEQLQECVWNMAKEMYGEKLPDIVQQRLEEELKCIIDNGNATGYIIVKKIMQKLDGQGCIAITGGSLGASLVAYMAGITEVDPLPPHYVCPKCKYSQFITDGSVHSGFDLPEMDCPICGETMKHDGHEIPYESLLGLDGKMILDIAIEFSRTHQIISELRSAKEHIIRDGVFHRVWLYSDIYRDLQKHLSQNNMKLNEGEIERIVKCCHGAKRSGNVVPEDMLLIPEDKDIHDFMPMQCVFDCDEKITVTSHFEVQTMRNTLMSMKAHVGYIPVIFKWLEKYTGVKVKDVPLFDKEVYSLFTSPEVLGITTEELGCKTGTQAISGQYDQIMELQIKTQPKSFYDLMQVYGLANGNEEWGDNIASLIENGTVTLSEVVTLCENIMVDLMYMGIDRKNAYEIMETVRKGEAPEKLRDDQLAILNRHFSKSYVDSCMNARYVTTKAEAAASMIQMIRLAWYKLNFPVEYYAAELTESALFFEEEVVLEGKEALWRFIDDPPQDHLDFVDNLQTVYEAMCRGVEFLPRDREKSSILSFKPEDGNIRISYWLEVSQRMSFVYD